MIAILVPVLGRPEAIEPFLASLRSSTKESYRVLFLCSPGDKAAIDAVWCKTSEDCFLVDWEAGPGDFAKKINLGYRLTQEPFVQIGATDLRFHLGWDSEALAVAEETHAGVIGTNDLHNPRVVRGHHSTHPLVRRSYIEEFGGTVDNSGDIFCELYDHQYVDDELVSTAKQRGQWAFAHESWVEHLHPYFGGSEMDATYKKALSNTRRDFRLFNQRRNMILRATRRERRP